MVAILIAAAFACAISPRSAPALESGAVATEHALAAAAGAEMLRAGGNAVDAAVAAAAAVCVVHASSCGLGGGGFALVHLANGQDLALDYREEAPARATLDRYQRDGRPDPALTQRGGLAVGVPGEVAGLAALEQRLGRLSLAAVLAPAARLARDGFRLAETPHLRREIERAKALLTADPGLRATFLGPDGAPPDDEFRIRQPDLAATLEAVGAEGPAALYRGARAAAVVAAVEGRGGVLTADDLRRYRPRWRRPLAGRLRGYRVVTFPPPGSGGVLLEITGILARDDLDALGPGTATALHLLAGAMAQAFADRAQWYGDPAFTTVPVATLLAPPRLAALRAGLSAVGVTAPRATLVADAGTAHVSAVDAAGNAAAITTTINTGFGAGILVPGTGIVLNNEMDDFALAPGVPNVFGLVGSEANALAPGKRPQSSMSPTIVLDGKRPVLVVGGSGGPTIISGVAQVALGVVACGRPLRDAVDAPRIHDQGTGALAVEPAISPAVRGALERLGHQVRVVPVLGAVAAAGLGPDGRPAAAGDPRKDGGAATVP
jgi:gamma-glutamyltranspeptidase / glutathione hydrolase